MKDRKLESLLLIARPVDNGNYSQFTLNVLQEIKRKEIVDRLHHRKHSSRWKLLWGWGRPTPRRALLLAMLLLIVGFISISGYAYAKGTDPFTLIKRWLVGKEVKVTYQDPVVKHERQFSHGVKRSYSDVAITAFAELEMLNILHFRATNAYTVPKDGFEHVQDPFNTDYHYPWVGVIEGISDTDVTLRKQYQIGDSKAGTPSRDFNERITIPKSDLFFYAQGEPTALKSDIIGKLVEVFQDQYLRHKVGSSERPISASLYSAFTLSYPLETVKEATKSEPSSPEGENRDIYEPNAGDFSTICLNNGADKCTFQGKKPEAGISLFSQSISPGPTGGSVPSNPDVMPFGEAVLVQTSETRQHIMRAVEGTITAIAKDRITLKTSSGATWSFEYLADRQQAFSRSYGSLKVGQKLGGTLVVSVYDLNRRDFGTQHVYTMHRY